ncbi:hypothetical protein Thal_1083 [Thermocrinis albus DSM 14484]|uniref:Uncharacterized protein n=1 Tax=Thermocrinis albus (strain DSM 14484 / JCM 11386 / HI 11/12) TaxID=638303 RepID=D3SLT5_THEAH|nr:hypothetical protein [Thermocrinis albus]ADC89715.1 hypothetical protein Thal_1083 [Thermocrinis albus DSM 14484]
MEEITHHVLQISRLLGLAEPVGFMLSYEMGDLWIDVYLEKDEDGQFSGRTYTLSVPLHKRERLESLVRSFFNGNVQISNDNERLYVSFSQEEWEEINRELTSLF